MHTTLLQCSIIASLLMPTAAQADEVIGLPMRVGVVGGYQLTSSDFDVLGVRRSALQPGDGALIGLRAAWRAMSVVDLELALALVPASTPTEGASALLLPVHLDLVARPFDWVVKPYASVGGGVMALVGGDAGSDIDALFHAALGAELVIDESVALRLEIGLFGTDAVEGAIGFSPTFLFGVDILAWRARPGHVDGGDWTPPDPVAPPVVVDEPHVDPSGDTDGDGLDNEDDRCPLHAGTERTAGCPDSDGDGVIDPWDRCPVDAGAGAGKGDGCPDSDGDGVLDVRDACPSQRGTAERYGCP
ncbi:MAG: hypothetical protein EP329_17570 [Deltaproteobacteria bacterium]|nr:MAG: hypothetical protein EP329_17570 [Deltaproteobacteria bacterium]